MNIMFHEILNPIKCGQAKYELAAIPVSQPEIVVTINGLILNDGLAINMYGCFITKKKLPLLSHKLDKNVLIIAENIASKIQLEDDIQCWYDIEIPLLNKDADVTVYTGSLHD